MKQELTLFTKGEEYLLICDGITVYEPYLVSCVCFSVLENGQLKQ